MPEGVIWITGAKNSGKTTLAHALYLRLRGAGAACEVIDEAELTQNLGHDPSADQIMYVARALAKNGIWSVVTSRAADRDQARRVAEASNLPFILVTVSGKSEVRGAAYPFLAPAAPDLSFTVDRHSPHELAEQVTQKIQARHEWNPPLIIFGKCGHASSVASSLAQDLGLFLGKGPDCGESGHSLPWVPIIHQLASRHAEEKTLPSGSSARRELRERATSFLSEGACPIGKRWGILVPESILIFPLLLDAFPGAKVLHLLRHPVSACLSQTERSAEPLHPLGRRTVWGAYKSFDIDPGRAIYDEPCIRNAISYQHEVSRAVYYARAVLKKENYLELRLEETCRDPDRALSAVAAFLGMASPRVKASGNIHPAMIDPWDPADERVNRIWELCAPIASLLGYRKELA